MLLAWGLLVVTLCCRSLCNNVDPVDPKATPVLSASPDHPWYIRGEAVTLRCTIPDESQIENYTLFMDYMPIQRQGNLTLHIPRLNQSHSGTYTCQKGDTYLNPERRSQKAIHVYNLPPAPLVSLKPLQDVYLAGQPVSVICSIYRDQQKSLFTFYRNGQKTISLESCTESVTLYVDTSLPWSGGNYTCGYQTQRFGKRMNSLNKSITINISDQREVTTTSTMSLAFQESTVTTEASTYTDTSRNTDSMLLMSMSDQNIQEKSTSPAEYSSSDMSRSTTAILLMSKPDQNIWEKSASPAEYSSSGPTAISLSKTATGIQQTSKELGSSTSQNQIPLQWTVHDDFTVTPISHSKDLIPSWMYYILGSILLLVAVGVLLVILLFKVYFSRNRSKRKPVKAPLWMNDNASDPKKAKTQQMQAIPRRIQEAEEQHIYTEIDENSPLAKSSSTVNASTALKFVPCSLPSVRQDYCTVQAAKPLPYVYCTPLLQTPLENSRP